MTAAPHPTTIGGGPGPVRPFRVRARGLARLAAPLAALLAGAWAVPAAAATLRGPLADSAAVILGAGPSQATWGILAVSLDRGDTLLALDPDRRLIPGSNLKVFTLGAFLVRQGTDPGRATELLARGKVRLRDGGRRVELKGDLVLRGCGMPDVVPLLSPGSRGLLDSLALLLRRSGLSRFEGTLWVDGSLFAHADPPRGWAVEDLPRGYGAPVTALMANGNAASVVASAGTSGGASVTLDPPDAPLLIAGTVGIADSEAAAWLRADRVPGTRVVRVAGAVARNSTARRTVSFPEPDSAAAVMLLGAMRREGIEVKARARPDAAELRERSGPGSLPLPGALAGAAPGDPAAEAAAWRSVGERGFATVASLRPPTAAEVVAAVAAYSLNPETEALLRLLDPAPSEKTPEGALRELRAALAQAGVDSADVSLADGSGLSVQNLVTPRAMVRWLTHMDRDTRLAPGEFAGLLPAPGSPGTLERRFRDLGPDSALHAKTGTLTNVSSLSGYVTARSGERVAFAFLSNGNARTVAPARSAEDALVGLLSRFERARVAPQRPPVFRIPR